MAVEHMVWIRFREGVSEQRQREHLDNLRMLKEHVPQVRELKVGTNFTDRAAGFTHGLIVTVDDQPSLQGYLEHPEHVKVAEPLKREADLMAMDIEV